MNTPFGKPSDVLIEGQIRGVPCVLLARHGRKHQFQPSDVNYRANMWALKKIECTHVLATTATGSLLEEYEPGDLVILDDFIDRTWGRKCTFYDRTDNGPRGVCHLPMLPAFCERARQALIKSAQTRGFKHHEKGTAVVIQGPRFSSRAESLMHRQWGGHLVNMTTVPEVVLAKEIGLSYAAIALVTDYDCWRENENSVSVNEVLAVVAKNVKKAEQVIIDAVQILAAETDLSYLEAHEIGIIGGSGLDDPKLFENQVEREMNTPFGKPSDVLIEGQIRGVPCVLLARHGRKHQFQPSDVNYRANMWALKKIECTHVLATTATGSLLEEYEPGDLVILDDFIDRTWGRKCTFYDRTDNGPRGVCHLPMLPAFCERARQALIKSAQTRGFKHHEKGTAVVIQGPRFSSRAESLMHRQWGGHLVNMTTVPEVVLAKEIGLSYAAIALVTDYDCWRENENSVSVNEVLAVVAKNVKKAEQVIIDAVQILAAETDLSYLEAHEDLASSSIMLKQ